MPGKCEILSITMAAPTMDFGDGFGRWIWEMDFEMDLEDGLGDEFSTPRSIPLS